MQTTYRLKADKLSLDIIDAVKSTYHNREITITIEDVQDETDFLLSPEHSSPSPEPADTPEKDS